MIHIQSFSTIMIYQTVQMWNLPIIIHCVNTYYIIMCIICCTSLYLLCEDKALIVYLECNIK